jgi:Holliday junction resolvasome RuvABC endonuclease subunit
VQELLRTHCATEFAIEAPFFGKNVQSLQNLFAGLLSNLSLATDVD